MKASISVGVGDRHAHEKRTVQNPGRDTHTHVCKTAVLVVEEEKEKKALTQFTQFSYLYQGMSPDDPLCSARNNAHTRSQNNIREK